tara:strand:- start:206 stop:376 length:171 start_codon:yes stop_codon:yes gene_type:complete
MLRYSLLIREIAVQHTNELHLASVSIVMLSTTLWFTRTAGHQRSQQESDYGTIANA